MDVAHLVRAHAGSADKDHRYGTSALGKRFAPRQLAGKAWVKKGNLLPCVGTWMLRVSNCTGNFLGRVKFLHRAPKRRDGA